MNKINSHRHPHVKHRKRESADQARGVFEKGKQQDGHAIQQASCLQQGANQLQYVKEVLRATIGLNVEQQLRERFTCHVHTGRDGANSAHFQRANVLADLVVVRQRVSVQSERNHVHEAQIGAIDGGKELKKYCFPGFP